MMRWMRDEEVSNCVGKEGENFKLIAECRQLLPYETMSCNDDRCQTTNGLKHQETIE
jgi:hypothetical protein